MNRREFITVMAAGAFIWPLPTRAQQGSRIRLIGVVMSYNENQQEVQAWVTAFNETLEKLGWIKGQNIKFEYRWTGNDATLIARAAKEIAALQPDLILSPSSPSTVFLLKYTHDIPVVFVNVVDPVGQGFVERRELPFIPPKH